MGKKGISLFIVACALWSSVMAQNDSAKGYVHKGLLRASLTYSIGIMPAVSLTNAYLTGNMEYYADSKISVRGDSYYFFNSLNNADVIKQNDQLYFGALYNFPVHSHFNPFIGLQPGMAYVQANLAGDPASFSPLASVITGFNYYAEKWFHIMLNIRYSAGNHLDEVSLFNMNELSFSFGLGLNIDTSPKYRPPVRVYL